MAREQFAALAQRKEWQVTESVALTRQNIAAHFLLRGYVSRLTENVAEYIMRVVPKLTFKSFFRLLAEGLISGCSQVLMQI